MVVLADATDLHTVTAVSAERMYTAQECCDSISQESTTKPLESVKHAQCMW